ncbi:MAG: HAMP domain-containing histidine kinase [Elusimicrobia bacterium]|nr:HAMP domain-containing histidine kinase [Elusimicrobiota bacterium]
MTIRNKLGFTATTAVLTTGLVGWIFFWTHGKERAWRDTMIGSTEKLTRLKELSADIERQIARIDFFVITKDAREIQIFEALSKANANKLKALEPVPWENLYRETVKNGEIILNLSAVGPARWNQTIATHIMTSGTLRRLLQEHLQGQTAALNALRQKTEEGLKRLERLFLGIIILSVLMAVLMNSYVYHSIIRPLQKLNDGVVALGQGRSDTQVPVQGRDELGTLGRAFNEMVVKLQELDRMKQEFTASITHELRSPLSAAQSLVNTLLSDFNNFSEIKRPGAADLDRWRLFLTRITVNMENLHRFVSDILETTKIEQGKLDCRLERSDLRPMLTETIAFFREKANQKNVALEVRINQMPACLADVDRVRQVIVNLIDNAIKFSARSSVVRMAAWPVDSQYVQISVKDSGPGIAKEYRSKIFQKFEQIKESYRYAEGAKGTGLGLAVCKAIVELHGGKIWVDSNGQGSIFSFTLPMAK